MPVNRNSCMVYGAVSFFAICCLLSVASCQSWQGFDRVMSEQEQMSLHARQVKLASSRLKPVQLHRA